MLTIMYKSFIWLLLSRGSGVRIPPGSPKKRNSRKGFIPYGYFFITLKEMQGYGASIVFYTCSILASGV